MRKYPAKILLFGEYSLMQGSNALAVPFQKYFGQWSRSEYCEEMTYVLVKLANYLEERLEKAPFHFDIQKLREDIKGGLYFESSIPMGYGVGSSGALCAAVYDHYAKEAIPSYCPDDQLMELKNHLSFIESYFHGSSSGLDPLVSYTKSALLLKADGTVHRLFVDYLPEKKVDIFLLDTQKHGHTSFNVKVFNDLLKEERINQDFKENYNPLVNQCISIFVGNEPGDLVSLLKKLSEKQQFFFESMIPTEFQKYIEMGRKTGKFSLKLCGSGGGGFMLGFTQDLEAVRKLFRNERIRLIPFYLK